MEWVAQRCLWLLLIQPERLHPPFLIVYGDGDTPERHELSKEFRDALKKAGGDAEALEVKDRTHQELFTKIGDGDATTEAALAFIAKRVAKTAQQFVLFDATFTFTKEAADNSKPSKSHYYVTGKMLNADRPKDWTRPRTSCGGSTCRPTGGSRSRSDFAQIAGRSPESHGANFKYDFSYEAIGDLIRQHVATYRVDLERFFPLVVFNYLVNNGDAHAKNFSLIRDDATGQYHLTPAYDLLNTRLHLPDETRTALDLFKDEFETESFRANAFYAYDDFAELAKRLGLVESRSKRILETFIGNGAEVEAMIDTSTLTDECKGLYKAHVRDRIRALSHSLTKIR